MDCARMNLFGYHFGTADAEERDLVEGHLVSCPACVASYVALKRRTDLRVDDRPSPELRARLRRDVAKAFPRSRTTQLVGWLARPVPLYKGALAAAFAFAALLLASSMLRSPAGAWREGASVDRGARIDTSRPTAESLAIC
jgi:anti-sigma factor RsiW